MKNYLSQLGYQKLTEELNFLLKVERPKVCETVAWAASLGDRSENADYQYGKKRLREIDKRVRFLNSRLSDIEIVSIANQQSETVKFGATVTTQIDEEYEKTYVILGPDEIDTNRGHISYMSPIGKALMGKKVGDQFSVQTPAGVHEYEVLKIQYIELN